MMVSGRETRSLMNEIIIFRSRNNGPRAVIKNISDQYRYDRDYQCLDRHHQYQCVSCY